MPQRAHNFDASETKGGLNNRGHEGKESVQVRFGWFEPQLIESTRVVPVLEDDIA